MTYFCPEDGKGTTLGAFFIKASGDGVLDLFLFK